MSSAKILLAMAKAVSKPKLVLEDDESDTFKYVAYQGKDTAGEISVVLEGVESGYPFGPYEGESFYDDINDHELVVSIQHLETEPKYRGKGVAYALVEQALKEIKKRWSGYPVYINASPMGGALSLESLIQFYKGFGFRVLKKYPEHRNALLWKGKL